jgi:RNA polymerase sigma-70 factor, ECF subfamily
VLKHLLSASSEGAGEHPRARSDLALLVTHLDAAYNLARWLMRNETEAEDVVQDAYVRAISHFTSFRGGDGRAWLLTIVRNSCYDRLKQRGASGQDTDFDETVHSAGRQTPDPETSLLLAERTELLTKSLAKLPAQYREVLVLRELEQLSYREIATIARIPVGTVMSRLSRARQQLEQTLLDYMERGELDVSNRDFTFRSAPQNVQVQQSKYRKPPSKSLPHMSNGQRCSRFAKTGSP